MKRFVNFFCLILCVNAFFNFNPSFCGKNEINSTKLFENEKNEKIEEEINAALEVIKLVCNKELNGKKGSEHDKQAKFLKCMEKSIKGFKHFESENFVINFIFNYGNKAKNEPFSKKKIFKKF
jgi:hypothetical protein